LVPLDGFDEALDFVIFPGEVLDRLEVYEGVGADIVPIVIALDDCFAKE